MGFLSATGNVIEAVLTRKGRELLAKGQFNITKYAFGDDEVNYNLYDNSLGSDADSNIISLPITEPSTNNDAIRNLLITMDSGTQVLSWLSVNPTAGRISGTNAILSFYARTMNKVGSPETYSIIDVNQQVSWNNNINVRQVIMGNQTNVEFNYKQNVNITSDTVFTFKLRGNETGIISDTLTLSAVAFTGAGEQTTLS